MKKIILVLLFFSSTVLAEPVRVTGTGPDVITARHDAFRKAIEYKIGSMVLSEKTVKSSKLIRNDVLVYSAGYIDDYVVIEDFDGNTITLDVYVNHSNIAKRIISTSNSSNFDGSRHSVQLSSLQHERELKRRYINMVMKEFPYHALVVTQNGYNLREDFRGQYILDVPFTIEWNKGFLNATKEMLNQIKDRKGNTNKNGNANIVYIPRRNTLVIEGFVLGSRSHYIFDNPEYMRIIKDHIHGKDDIPFLRVYLYDIYGEVQQTFCQRIKNKLFDTTNHPKFAVFYEKEKEKGMVSIPINFPVENIDSIEIELVKNKDCFRSLR